MAAITVSRKLGSLGNQIAQAVAETLSYRIVSRKVINRAACHSRAPEAALADIDDLGFFGLRPSYRARKAYRQAVELVLREFASEGKVIIVGRAGQIVLRDQPEILHVRVIAPVNLRITRIAAAQSISTAAAKAQIEQSDRARHSYLRRTYHVDWEDPELYDLTINTEHLNAVTASAIIIHALSQRL